MREQLELWEIMREERELDPDLIMLIDEPGTGITYREYWELSGRVYRYLKDRGISYEDVVLIHLPRSSRILACMVGVLRAGAAFVVTEDGFSDARTDFIRKDCEHKVLIDQAAWETILATEPLEGTEPVDLHDKAFICYTSGTTGHPKGVVHEYGTLVIDDTPPVYERGILPLIPSMDFVSTPIILMYSLFYTITLAVVPVQCKKSDELLLTYMKEVGTTEGYFAPSFLRAHDVTDLGWSRVNLSSEPAEGLMVEGTRNYNLYASTESGRIISAYHITEPVSPTPIGRGYLQMKILREDGSEAAAGETGEVCYLQPYFRGYQHLPEKTAQTIHDGWVHSGDSGKRLEDRNIIVTGRLAETFKIDGFVINPDEIREALKSVLGLRDTVVRGFTYKGYSSICVFYTDPVEIDLNMAREALLKELPLYMIPNNYIHMPEFPVLKTGKLDKAALLPPEGDWERFRDEDLCVTEVLGSGRTSTVYGFGPDMAVKLYNRDFEFRFIADELGRGQGVYKLGVSCPRIYGMVCFDDRYGLLMESFKGQRTYEEALEADFSQCRTLIGAYVGGVRELHHTAASGGVLTDIRQRFIAAAEQLTDLYGPETVGLILKELQHIPDRKTLLQKDCHIGNCFAYTERPVFFDLTYAGYGHPILDLCDMYAHMVLWPSVNRRGKLTVEQCREVFDTFLCECLETDDAQRLADGEHQLRCISNIVILLGPVLSPGLYPEPVTDAALASLQEDADWFVHQQLME